MHTSGSRLSAFYGTGVALVTPFTPDLAVDYVGWRHLLDFCIEGGIEYLVVNGTTGESPTTTAAEKAELLRTAVEHVAGRVPLVYGIGGNDTMATEELFRTTDLSGVAAILSASPAYNKPSQPGLIAHYTRLAAASPLHGFQHHCRNHIAASPPSQHHRHQGSQRQHGAVPSHRRWQAE